VILLASAPAGASVTIGQTGPPGNCVGSLGDVNTHEFTQSPATSGTYVVPASNGITSWTVTSWSTQTDGSNGYGMFGMKVERPLGGMSYMVVGHDGPHMLTPGGLNTFAASVPARAGDVIGVFLPPPDKGPCFTVTPGQTLAHNSPGGLADGESGM